ncbi:MAG: GMP synthase [Kangiella sp.]|nr:MAG: GMP synthase [Kangiella sp.]
MKKGNKVTLKLGILICDHVNKLLQGEFESYPKMFDDLFSSVEDNLDVKYYFVIDDQFPKNINECDAYMTSGSQFGANDDLPWIKKLIEFIQTLYHADKPFIGICFGHQLIAKALGGKVEKSTKSWGVGVHTSKIISQKNWMNKDFQEFNLIVSHQDQISQLPTGAEVLASSEFCPYSMIQVGNHFIGLQGHPEFTLKYSESLMEVRKDRISSAVISKGQKSFLQPLHSKDVMQWLFDFLNYRKSL